MTSSSPLLLRSESRERPLLYRSVHRSSSRRNRGENEYEGNPWPSSTGKSRLSPAAIAGLDWHRRGAWPPRVHTSSSPDARRRSSTPQSRRLGASLRRESLERVPRRAVANRRRARFDGAVGTFPTGCQVPRLRPQDSTHRGGHGSPTWLLVIPHGPAHVLPPIPGGAQQAGVTASV